MAIVYALLTAKGEPRYVGSTTASLEKRVQWHLGHVSGTARWNPELAAFLSRGIPQWQELAVVPDAERFTAEAEITKRLRRKHRLCNVKNGSRHTPESIRRIRAGRERAQASRSG